MSSAAENFSNIAELLLHAESATTNADVAELIRKYAEAFAYEGFDVVTMSETFKAAVARFGGNDIKHIRSMATLAVGLIVNRSSKVSKIREKSSDQMKNNIQRLEAILTTKVGSRLGKNDITLPRIAAIYPELTARACTKVNRNILPGFESFHPLIRSHFFAAVCPSDPEFLEVARVNLYWRLKFDKMVKPNAVPDAAQAAKFWTASHSSRLMGNAERLFLMKDLDLVPSAYADMTKVSFTEGLPQLTFAAPILTPVYIPGMGFESPRPPTPTRPSILGIPQAPKKKD